MALPLGRESFHIVRAGKPRLGEVVPSAVEAELVLDLKSFNDNIKREWNELREFDNLFLLTIDMSSAVDEDIEEDVAGTSRLNDEDDLTFGKRFGIRAVRGVEVVSMVDEAGKAMNEMGNGSDGIGSRRTLRVTLDAAQYHKDIKSGDEGVYSSFNVVVRRSGKENNFHAVLETMVELMKGEFSYLLPRASASCLLPCFRVKPRTIFHFALTSVCLIHEDKIYFRGYLQYKGVQFLFTDLF